MEQNKLLDIEIITPQKVIYTGKAASVAVPGTKGPFQILNMHAPIVSTLDIGLTKIVDEANKEIFYATGSGFTEVHKNTISILVESAFNAADINIDETREELAKSKEALKESKNDELLKVAILEAENKIKAAEKHKGS